MFGDRSFRRVGLAMALLAVAGVCPAADKRKTPPQPAPLKTYETAYYTIHSDLDRDTVREAAVRVTAMFREYRRRTAMFTGKIRKRLPFYLYGNPRDYYAAGGMPGSIGVYNGQSLKATTSKRHRARLWNIIQHEGLHQFVHKVMRGNIPIWVNEGLAEYFGDAIWTGDHFVVGVIPQYRLRRLQALIEAEQLLPFDKMLSLSRQQWRATFSGRNYDQAWSMTHFLIHADSGRYCKAFEAFIVDVSRTKSWRTSFHRHFGRDVGSFEARYKQWWMALPANPTENRYILATVQTLTSFLGRAHSQGQTFADAEGFFAAARAGKLKAPAQQWLPPSLLSTALRAAGKLKGWSLQGRLPQLVLTLSDGRTFTGSFRIQGRTVSDVQVAFRKTPPGSKAATQPASQASAKPQ